MFLSNTRLPFRYHIYKQNQIRLNNNNSTRVNLNVNRPAPVPQPEVEAQENADNAETDAPRENSVQPEAAEPLIAEPTVQEEPPVPFHTIIRTFVLSFFTSIIPEAL